MVSKMRRRLRGFDYSSDAFFFVTAVCRRHQHFFGELSEGKVVLNSAGKICHEEWLRTFEMRDYVTAGSFIVMPNHMHAIISFGQPKLQFRRIHAEKLDLGHITPYFSGAEKNLGAVMRGFKSSVTTRVKKELNMNHFQWESGFHDRIITSFEAKLNIEAYIQNNPVNVKIKKYKR